MPVVKKDVFKAVAATLRGEVDDLRRQIRSNRHDMNRLTMEMNRVVAKQTLAKRKLAELDKLAREFEGKE